MRGPLLSHHRVTLSTMSLASLAPNFGANTPGSAAWPAANRAIYIPFKVSEPILVKRLFVYNGATASGNADIGIYSSRAADRLPDVRLVSAGSTAQAGTSDLQVFDVTDTWLGPGLFYWAFALDNTTGTVTRLNFGGTREGQLSGCMMQSSALPLPAAATPASFSGFGSGMLPIVGLSTQDTF